ncbi:kinase suppressor of Ras 2 [Tulasnella sp. 424]|nr:kinase suppressor of Ras 2 [Tulasnella sp. 424]
MEDTPAIKIPPQAVLKSLSDWRIQPNRISFPENGTQKQGASANVRLAKLSLDPAEQSKYSTDSLLVAVKSFRFCDNKADARVLASLAQETSLLSKLCNQNVVQLLGFAEDIAHEIAWIILPWEANGNVREFLNSTSSEIPERVSLIHAISCGVEYLHTREPPIRHGDLKSANILVNSQNRAVIIDFGSARPIEEPTLPKARVQKATMIPSEPLVDMQALNMTPPRVELKSLETLITLTGPAWTLRWAAPELVSDEDAGLASDIWAFGWICWEASYETLFDESLY